MERFLHHLIYTYASILPPLVTKILSNQIHLTFHDFGHPNYSSHTLSSSISHHERNSQNIGHCIRLGSLGIVLQPIFLNSNYQKSRQNKIPKYLVTLYVSLHLATTNPARSKGKLIFSIMLYISSLISEGKTTILKIRNMCVPKVIIKFPARYSRRGHALKIALAWYQSKPQLTDLVHT